MRRSAFLRDVAAVLVLVVGGVLALIGAFVFGFEVALATFVATLTLATAATVARLILTDDVS